MIVTCESCSTSFQLDESRIPPTGARVRCSRCKHAFFLANPAASQAEAVHSIAAEAVEEAADTFSVGGAEEAQPSLEDVFVDVVDDLESVTAQRDEYLDLARRVQADFEAMVPPATLGW